MLLHNRTTKKRMTVGAEYERRRKIAAQQKKGGRRSSFIEILDLTVAACPAFAKRPDFRQYALKNTPKSVPIFKVSVEEIYRTCNVKLTTFKTDQHRKPHCDFYED
jgi:hypothetical protein